jgi:uncharacterized protein (TIGR02271 family)
MDVPVRHEEVVIERHPVEPRPANADFREGQDIRIPLTAEQVHVEKQPVVTEEMTIGKREVTETERVGTDIRREEAHIEHSGDVRVHGESTGPEAVPSELPARGGFSLWTDVSSRYRQDFLTRHGSTARWEDYEPGYRYGYEMANDPRYVGRSFDEIELELRGDYHGWAERHGYQNAGGGWETVKDTIRETFGGARTRRAA